MKTFTPVVRMLFLGAWMGTRVPVGCLVNTETDSSRFEPTQGEDASPGDVADASGDAVDDGNEGQGHDGSGHDVANDHAADGPAPMAEAGPTPLPWYEGTFRYLPAVQANLVAFVGDLSHPNQGGYGKVSSSRAGKFDTMLKALFEAIERAHVDGALPDWCGVRELAAQAGYELQRFREEATGRWLLYGWDTTTYGQAYFFINPEPQRNVIVEAPHDPFDWATGKQGARIFMALAARAFLLNKEHRCSDPDATPCSGTTSACHGYYRESDVAHHTANTFHLLHRYLSDNDPDTRFVQLHGFAGNENDYVEASDGSRNKNNPSSVSIAFINALKKLVPTPNAVFSCQDPKDPPPLGLCATTNVQARATHDPFIDACTEGTKKTSGRFLHIEQAKALRQDSPSKGWSWTQVRDALHETWPDCRQPGCALGPPLPNAEGCTCGMPCDP